jgi:hypothetical protein
MSSQAAEHLGFLNVDLDIYSTSSLRPLVAALGRDVIVLYVGREGGVFSAHLELNLLPESADSAIRGFAALIKGLPQSKRKLWEATVKRVFSIGIQAAADSKVCEVQLSSGTVRMVAALRAQIAVTVYGTGIAGKGRTRLQNSIDSESKNRKPRKNNNRIF